MLHTHRRHLPPGAPIRTLVVDDSSFVRRCVTGAFERDADIQIVGTASNGLIALSKVDQLNPDAVVLDIEMPEMDGLETLAALRRRYPQLVVIMFSTLTERGASTTLKALSLGADDYVTKNRSGGGLDRSLDQLRSELGSRLRQFFHPAPAVAPHRPPPVRPVSQIALRIGNIEAVAIGSSTGGPAALGELLPSLPESIGVPVFVVQHMPALFTRLLAERLDTHCSLPVREATDGARVNGAEIWIAPGDYHMRVERFAGSTRLTLDQAPPENSCRPSVDVLFRSVADTYRGGCLGVVLTGMGHDGQRGASALKAVGARILAQDEETSVVWGMPGAVVEEDLADWVLPIDRIAPHLVQHLSIARRAAEARSTHEHR